MHPNPRAKDELIRRSCFGGWTWYLWTVAFTLAVATQAYLTLRRGILPILEDPVPFLLLVLSLIVLVVHLHSRPRRQRQGNSRA